MADNRAEHDAANDRLRDALRRVMRRNQWGQVRVSEELGFAQQTISTFLSKRSGASLLLALGIARLEKVPLGELITGEPDPSIGIRFSSLPDWRAHESAARVAHPFIPEAAFDAVGQWRGESPPPTVTPEVVTGLAEVWWKSSLMAAVRSESDSHESHTRRRTSKG